MEQHSALITDSGCDLPDATLAQHKITLVPLYVIWGQQALRDRVDITPQAFYDRLVTDPVHPTTSQPQVNDFVQAFRQAQSDGATEAVVITISSGMSSTHASAQQAARLVDLPVHVIDSKANSLSEGWMVLAAAHSRAAGGSTQDMIAAAEHVRQRLVTRLYVDTLEYLHKGGRIGRAAMWVGTMLNLKPLLWVDHATGRIEPRDRARSRAKALDKMVDDFFGQLGSVDI